MLKILKSRKEVTFYKDEFNAIKHGDYFDFISLIGEPIPFIVSWRNGTTMMEDNIKKDDIDFVGLLKAGPSIKKFYELCKITYGYIQDPDLSDEDFYNVATFEIALRMHANNNNLLNERETLEKVIDKLCEFKNISESDRNQLHQGRKFGNMIKQHKMHFDSWHEGLTEFNKAFEIIQNNKLTII
ncbi:MAG: hypothetical protein P4L34_04860 [Paludibacter sp.]|nr:hypothetical protein [Paludibacter sp.]